MLCPRRWSRAHPCYGYGIRHVPPEALPDRPRSSTPHQQEFGAPFTTRHTSSREKNEVPTARHLGGSQRFPTASWQRQHQLSAHQSTSLPTPVSAPSPTSCTAHQHQRSAPQLVPRPTLASAPASTSCVALHRLQNCSGLGKRPPVVPKPRPASAGPCMCSQESWRASQRPVCKNAAVLPIRRSENNTTLNCNAETVRRSPNLSRPAALVIRHAWGVPQNCPACASCKTRSCPFMCQRQVKPQGVEQADRQICLRDEYASLQLKAQQPPNHHLHPRCPDQPRPLV